MLASWLHKLDLVATVPSLHMRMDKYSEYDSKVASLTFAASRRSRVKQQLLNIDGAAHRRIRTSLGSTP